MSLFTSLFTSLVNEFVHEPTIEHIHEHANEPHSRAFRAELSSVKGQLDYKVKLQILFKLGLFIIEPSSERAFIELSSKQFASGLTHFHP